MAEILHQLIGSLSHYLQGCIHPRWCRISAINSIKPWVAIAGEFWEELNIFGGTPRLGPDASFLWFTYQPPCGAFPVSGHAIDGGPILHQLGSFTSIRSHCLYISGARWPVLNIKEHSKNCRCKGKKQHLVALISFMFLAFTWTARGCFGHTHLLNSSKCASWFWLSSWAYHEHKVLNLRIRELKHGGLWNLRLDSREFAGSEFN